MKVYVLTDCDDRMVGIYSTNEKAKAAERKFRDNVVFTHELGTSIEERELDA